MNKSTQAQATLLRKAARDIDEIADEIEAGRDPSCLNTASIETQLNVLHATISNAMAGKRKLTTTETAIVNLGKLSIATANLLHADRINQLECDGIKSLTGLDG